MTDLDEINEARALLARTGDWFRECDRQCHAKEGNSADLQDRRIRAYRNYVDAVANFWRARYGP